MDEPLAIPIVCPTCNGIGYVTMTPVAYLVPELAEMNALRPEDYLPRHGKMVRRLFAVLGKIDA